MSPKSSAPGSDKSYLKLITAYKVPSTLSSIWQLVNTLVPYIVLWIAMAYLITDACISCGSCESECPSGAISAGDTQYNIDPDVCIDCGACESVCPVQAIKAN